MTKLQRDIAYEKLRRAITYGEFKPGDNLIEKDICNNFDIGRTPLREAFRQLQMEGYIEVLPNKGAIVHRTSIKEIEDVYDFLALLEGHAVELAVKHITASQIAELEKIEKETRMFSKSPVYEKWLRKNDEFHRYFIKLTGNKILEEEIKRYRRRIYRYRALSISIQGNIEKLVDQHQLILMKTSKKKPAEASNAMRRHIRSAKGLLVRFLQQNSWI
jgi:DNA-binding GntR family transcriptional regulator